MIAIIDDEPIWIKLIENELIGLGFSKSDILGFTSVDEFKKSEVKFTIAFFDVELTENDISGLELCGWFKKNNPDSYAIILTSHTELTNYGYRVNAYRYINKENLTDEIKEAVDSIKKEARMQHKITIHVVGTGDLQVELASILYVESDKHNTLIHMTKNTVLPCSIGIRGMWEILKEYDFLLPHQAFIVNPNYIETYDKIRIQMSNNEYAGIARTKYRSFNDSYIQWKISRSK